jgi:hypothetical protein
MEVYAVGSPVLASDQCCEQQEAKEVKNFK